MEITEERFKEELSDAFGDAATFLKKLNPAAYNLIKGLEILKASVGDGGDFNFRVNVNPKSGVVVITTSLETDKFKVPFSIVVDRGGCPIITGNSSGLQQKFMSRDWDENVINAYNAIATESLMQGQVALPDLSAAERGFNAAADKLTRQELIVDRLVSGLKQIEVLAAATGSEFGYTKHELEADGAILLRTKIQLEGEKLYVEVSADGEITHNIKELMMDPRAYCCTVTDPPNAFIDRLMNSIGEQAAALPAFCRPPARATISPTTI